MIQVQNRTEMKPIINAIHGEFIDLEKLGGKLSLISKDVIVHGLNTTWPAFYILPESREKFPGVILVHEIWGFTEHIKEVAKRIAHEGYAVLVPHLFAGMPFENKFNQSIMLEMTDPTTQDQAQKKMRELLAPMNSPGFSQGILDKLYYCYNFILQDKRTNGNIAALGFGFGGTYTFAFAVNEPRLKAAVSFYGKPTESLDQIERIQCPILAFYGEYDKNLTHSASVFREAMQKRHKNFEFDVYPGAGHAFFNDTNANTFNHNAAQNSWKSTLLFLEKHLRGPGRGELL